MLEDAVGGNWFVVVLGMSAGLMDAVVDVGVLVIVVIGVEPLVVCIVSDFTEQYRVVAGTGEAVVGTANVVVVEVVTGVVVSVSIIVVADVVVVLVFVGDTVVIFTLSAKQKETCITNQNIA